MLWNQIEDILYFCNSTKKIKEAVFFIFIDDNKISSLLFTLLFIWEIEFAFTKPLILIIKIKQFKF